MHKKLVTIISLCIVLTACDQPVEKGDVIKPVLAMRVSAAQNQAISMMFTGEVRSRYESNIGFRVPGKIIKRYVDIGAQVKKGQLLATIDPKDAQLNTLAARADVKAAEANHHLAEVELARKKELFAKKFISKSALDAQIAQFEASLAQVKQAKSQAAVSSNQSVYTRLLADRAGIVADITAEPGQVVTAGQVIATILDADTLEVMVPMPESKIGEVRVGDQVTVAMWADKSKVYQGKVREIAPAANMKTRAFDVRVAVSNADAAIKAGMTADVGFALTNANQHIIVPSTAVTAKQGQSLVWVIDKKGVTKSQPVTIGEFSEAGVPIQSGIQAGDIIAIAGVHTLVEGQQVKPIYAASDRKY